ncbi:MAG: DNA polymerase III subunit delta, partial [Syntrophales bacterium]|nr:DNA polymerase III subunit delta [Syntrophales bacterium]
SLLGSRKLARLTTEGPTFCTTRRKPSDTRAALGSQTAIANPSTTLNVNMPTTKQAAREAVRDKDQGVSLEMLLTEIAQGRVRPCYLLYGAEHYLVHRALSRLIDALLPPEDRSLNLAIMEGNETDIDTLCEILLTAPLLPNRKVVVVKSAPFFQAKGSPGDLAVRVREGIEKDPQRAALDFMALLTRLGWNLDDLKDGGWKGITDEMWSRAVGAETAMGREEWLPKIVDLCLAKGLQPPRGGGEVDRLGEILQGGLPDGHILIMTAETVDQRKRLYQIVAATGAVVAFTAVKGEKRQRSQLEAAAAELLAAAGKTMTEEAWLALGRKTGFDLAVSMGALERLILYTEGRRTIGAEDVETLIVRSREEDIFALTTALAEGKTALALQILNAIIDGGTAPLMILTMVAREVRLLLHARIILDYGLGEGFKPDMPYPVFQSRVYGRLKALTVAGVSPEFSRQHPFVIYNSMKHATRFTYKGLVKQLERLATADLAMKSTGAEPRFILERFISSFAENQGT